MAKSESEKDIRQKNENLNKTVQEQDVAERNQAYNEYVKQVTPTHNLALKMLKAFVTGGIICCIGQVILNIAQNAGLDKDTSGGWCSMILVLMSVIRQFSGGSCHRIQKGRSGLWDWLQNFYHCGSGNPLWNLYKLATWGHILDISADSEVDGKGVSHSRKSDTAVKQSCGSDPSRVLW